MPITFLLFLRELLFDHFEKRNRMSVFTNQNQLTKRQKKSLEEKQTGIQKLKEVWLIWNGKLSKIKK